MISNNKAIGSRVAPRRVSQGAVSGPCPGLQQRVQQAVSVMRECSVLIIAERDQIGATLSNARPYRSTGQSAYKAVTRPSPHVTRWPHAGQSVQSLQFS